MPKLQGDSASKRDRTAPDPNDSRKPDQLSEITKPSWAYVLKKTAREFGADQGTDLAAALTYYGVLAVFPALLAFVSLLGLFGDPGKTTKAILDLARGLVPNSTLQALQGPLQELTHSHTAGLALAVGIIGALWSASGYVAAFSRAMNRIYSIQEGRPFWKLRPVTLGVTVLAIGVAVIAALLITTSGPIAQNLGAALHVGQTFVITWNIVKWPVLAFLAVAIVAVLYYATPNVQQPHFRWMSLGALLALVVWVLASVGFAFYAANFASYNKTYGSIGGVIVFLLWVWISNLALLFGAELDAELERGRELQAGMKAEDTIQLPPRDTRASDKAEKARQKDIAQGKRLREHPTRNPEDGTESTPKKADAKGDQEEAHPVDNKPLKGVLKALVRTNRTQARAIRGKSNDRR